MLRRLLRFLRLPLVLLVVFAIGRLCLGPAGVPYAPSGSMHFSIGWLTLIVAFIYDALSGKIGGFGWGGAALCGFVIGLASQILIFLATWVSFAADIPTSYYRHWDFLRVAPGTPVEMAAALGRRALALVAGPFVTVVPALLGRALDFLVAERR